MVQLWKQLACQTYCLKLCGLGNMAMCFSLEMKQFTIQWFSSSSRPLLYEEWKPGVMCLNRNLQKNAWSNLAWMKENINICSRYMLCVETSDKHKPVALLLGLSKYCNRLYSYCTTACLRRFWVDFLMSLPTKGYGESNLQLNNSPSKRSSNTPS